MERLGIISGNGQLPFIAARQARAQGLEVFVCAISGETDPSISELVSELNWVKLGELKKLVKFFKKHNVSQVCMEGKITKTNIFAGDVKPDLDMLLLFSKLKDKKDDTILGAICDYLEKNGLEVIDSTKFLSECLPGEGVLTKKKPNRGIYEDICFGWDLAKESARLDIGQAVVVKDRAVLAVEAIEGTDAAIKRGGKLGKGKVVVVKVEKPNQDMRFDVPAIGPNTIESLIEASASAIAFEAGKTIFIEKNAVVAQADKNGIVLVGVSEAMLRQYK